MNKKWVSTSANPCPSCAALHGQIHSADEWDGLKPGHDSLYCQEHCTCHLEETEEEPSGSIDAVPLRGEMLAGTLGANPEPQSRALSEQPERTHTMQKDFSLKATVTATEEGFDILAIDEGEAKGHGIRFSALALQSAVPLYEGKPVFIDHAGLGASPSVRDLAGTLHAAQWDPNQRGIRAMLKPSGPSAEILTSLRDAAKGNPAIMEAVGFSTVLRVQLEKDGNVKQIVSVKSVDVVIDPARGGKFLQEINGRRAEDQRASRVSSKSKGVIQMAKSKKFKAEITNAEGATEEVTLEAIEDQSDTEAQLERNAQAAAALLGETQRRQEEEVLLQQSRQTLASMCEYLLTTGLSTSRLPAPTQERIRKQYTGRVFEAHELSATIEDARKELAAVMDGANITGLGRNISLGMNGEEEYKLALEDLFGMPREVKDQNKRVRPLSGIREAYLAATGDNAFMGGYHREFALVTANFPGIVANVMNKMLIQAWQDFEQHYGWWKKITTIEHFSNLNDVSWVRTGTIASLPSVSERGEYTELPIGDNKETSTWEKFGGYVPLTIEAVLRDDLRAFKRMPREAALAGIRNISEQIAEIFTTASGAGPTLADTGALFNATAVTTAGGHANLLTTALGTDYTAWNTVSAAVFNQPLQVKNATGSYGTGKKQAIDPSYILVPRALKNQAEALFLPRWEAQAQNVAAVSPSWGGRVEVLTVPEWTDATDWAAAVDPKLVPSVMLGEIFGIMPQIFNASSEIDPAMFANDESRLKVRQFLAVGVADFRGLHKSNVA